jgi:CheY-like chemotaxis protein
VHEDAIMISGKASEDVVDMCLASNVTYLLEKPVKPYALQLAVRAITAKYLNFAKKLLRDPSLAQSISRL